MNKYFVETGRYLHAEEIFFRKGIVIFSGPPGCGKTMAAVHLLLKLLEEDKDLTFRKISRWEEMLYIDEDEMSLVFIDNIFLNGTMDSDFENWWYTLKEVYLKYLTRGDNGSNRLRIIMTAGTNAIERACDFMRKSIPILKENLLINLNCLEENEKDDIFFKQVEFAKKEKNINFPDVDDKFIIKIRKSEGPIGFPLCANLYVCGEKYREKGPEFFSYPIEYLKHQIEFEINKDKKHQKKSLFFFLFFYEREREMREMGKLEKIDIKDGINCRRFLKTIFTSLDETFGPFAFNEMEREAQRLVEFFKNDGHQYTFVHSSVYEAVGTYFCEQSIERTAKYFPLDILQNQEFGRLKEQEKAPLYSRLLEETQRQRLSNVFACKLFQNRQFADFFSSQLQKENREAVKLFFTLENTYSRVRLPAMFWVSCYNLPFLTECFYDIITKIFSDTDNQLFVSLYGLCCANNEGSWKIIAGSFDEQFEQIKKHVLAFRDDQGNSILHLIITNSDFTDQFVATAVEKMIGNNKHFVDCKNNLKVTPIMAAVEQPIRREKVIKTLIKLSAKLKYRDSYQSTVFHHCLRSPNDDETCAKYLKLLLEVQDTGKLLCKEDANENTVLNIAAKESKYSRIQSIIILLESNADIVDTLNEDGYSPLHFCVTSLSGDPISVELECCARVIILLLYGADPEKKSDENNKPIDQCKYESVKKVLQNYKDQEIMENELDILIEKMNWQESYDEFDEKCIPSVKFTPHMRERLAKVFNCQKNIRFH